MASSRKWKPHSDETKAKIGAASLGKRLSDETRAKLSVAIKGRARPIGSGKPNQKIKVLDILTNKSKNTIQYVKPLET